MAERINKITVIIPAYNEENYIGKCLSSLANQSNPQGNSTPHELLQIVVVDNGCTDHTEDIVKRFQFENKDLTCHIVKEKVKGVVPARVTGYNYILSDNSLSTELLASSDADVTFDPHWVYTVLNKYEKEGYDLLSNAGCFPLDFWIKVPNLTSRYLEEIGTIFFNQETIDYLGVRGKYYLFTEQIFFDFNRLITDQCFVVNKGVYQQVGGYTRDYIDEKKTKEIFDEGGRLMAKIEKTPAKIIYSREAPYTASPRRILAEPDKFLTGNSYVDGVFNDYRQTAFNDYERLNKLALKIDYTFIKKYILKNYIISRCITRPNLVLNNQHYFKDLSEELVVHINNWWSGKKLNTTQEVYWFAEELTHKYYERLITNFPKQQVFLI